MHTNKRAHYYFVVGMLGAFLWFVLGISEIAAGPIYMMQNPSDSLWLFLILVVNVSSIVGILYYGPLGFGFLGLSSRYNEKYARYVFYVFVAMFLLGLPLVGLYTSSKLFPISMALSSVLNPLRSVTLIIIIALAAFSLWRIGSKSNHSNLFVFLAVLWCVYLPLPFVFFALGPGVATLVAGIIQSLASVLMLRVFYLESRAYMFPLESASVL